MRTHKKILNTLFGLILAAVIYPQVASAQPADEPSSWEPQVNELKRIGPIPVEDLNDQQINKLKQLREERQELKQAINDWYEEIEGRIPSHDFGLRELNADIVEMNNRIRRARKIIRAIIAEDEIEAEIPVTDEDETELETEILEEADDISEPDLVYVDDGQDDFNAGLNSGGCTLSSTAPNGTPGSMLGLLICGAIAILLKKRTSA